jgi:ureidoacrylate peracid hydrolase
MAEILTSLETRIDPAYTALLVVDMQNDFCAEGGYIHRAFRCDMNGSAGLARSIMRLAGHARRKGVPVVWIAANYDPEKVAEPFLARRAQAGIDAVCCAGGAWGSEFFMVEPAPGEPVVVKHRYDAFFATGLDVMLRERGVRTAIVTGVSTNACIDATVKGAFFHGFYAVVPSDCVGSHRRDMHDATLTNIAALFGDVTTVDEIARAWGCGTGSD